MNKYEICEKLKDRLKVDPEETVTTFIIADVFECMVDRYGERLLNFSDKQLMELLEVGKDCIRNLPWAGLVDAWLEDAEERILEG